MNPTISKINDLETGIQDAISLDKERKRQQLKQQLSKEVLKASPFLLGKHILGFDRFCAPHKTWDKFARQHLDFTCKRPSKTLILQPRETFKSTFWTVNCTINFIVNNPDVSILIVSSTGATSTALLRQITAHLRSNEKLIATFGQFYNENMWNQNEITISQRTTLNTKEPTVKAVSKGSFITGFHPDVIIWDDAIGPSDRDSATERAATVRCFQDCFDVLKKETGQFVICGTRYHMQDIYQHIKTINKTLQPESRFAILETPAYNRESGELNFPEILTATKLAELRLIKAGSDALDFSSFESQYMLNPLSSAEQIFKVFHYYDPETTEYDVAIQFTDPAISKTGCYSASIVIAKIKAGEHKSKWAVLATSIEKRTATKLIGDIIELHKFITSTYKIDCACFCEQNGFQALLKDNIMKTALEGGYQLPISGKTTTENKMAKIAALEPYITGGFLLFRKDWERASGGYRLLMEQLKEFPQAELDGPDCLAMANQVSRGRYFQMDLNQEQQ